METKQADKPVISPPGQRDGGLSEHGKRRATVVLFVFSLWTVILIARLAQYMVVQRERRLADMQRDSMFEGVVPARRGRILDRHGHPLAWSTRHFSAHWKVPSDPVQAQRHWDILLTCPALAGDWDAAFPFADLAGREVVLREDLAPETAATLEDVQDRVPGLRLTSYFVRHRRGGEGLLQQLGQVRLIAGTELGVSGWERDHDPILRGVPGRYRVMLDRKGDWIPATWRVLRDMRPGYDVYVPTRGPESEEGSKG